MPRMGDMEDIPLANPRREEYCRRRVEGMTQRQAMLAAWPDRARWKPATVDNKACKLEATDEVKARIAALKRMAADKSTTTRAEVIAGMSETFEAGMARVRRADPESQLDYTAVNTVTQLGRTLLDVLPEDGAGTGGEPFCRDFATLIGKDFFRPHMLMAKGAQREFWCRGGRGSLKSSWASLELVRHIETHPGEHAAALMKRKNSLRDAVYAQVVWAIHELGLADGYEMPVSTLRIRKKSTGQLILFAGCDDPAQGPTARPSADATRARRSSRAATPTPRPSGWARSSSRTPRHCAPPTRRRTATSTWASRSASAGRSSTAWSSAR